jgi:hypothetical protein
MDWLWVGYGLVMGWLWVGYGLGMGWLWVGYGLVMGWVGAGYGLTLIRTWTAATAAVLRWLCYEPLEMLLHGADL